jgi:predicted RNA-binding protein with RPS1 domain
MVKVLSKDSESGKITLSIKAAKGDLGANRSERGADARSQKSDYSRDHDQKPKHSEMSFDEKLKDWIKQSNERQAGINKRNNRR